MAQDIPQDIQDQAFSTQEGTILRDASQAETLPESASLRTASQPTRTIAVIDGNSLMHRAFHAIRQPMSAPDGRATNALYGFFNMFIKLIDTYKPDGVICAFDKGKPQVRIDMLPQYKAQRPPMDPALHEQFPMVKELLGALDVPVVELAGWEGDDILGTLARRGEAEGYEMLLVTGDRDMYQLATNLVKILSTKKGMSDVSIMTPQSVDDLYHGITPNLVTDFYGLKGDSSDNIPGVPGIGPKKAAALIVEYGSLEGVIAHADEIPGKMGENLRAHIDDARLSKKVATILTNAPIDLNLDDAKFPTFNPAEVRSAFSALGFTGVVNRLLKLGGTSATAAGSAVQTDSAEHHEMSSNALTSTTAQHLEPQDPHEMVWPPLLTKEDEVKKALYEAFKADTWVGVSPEGAQEKDAQTALFVDENARVIWFATPTWLARTTGSFAQSCLVEVLEHKLSSLDVKTLLHEVYPLDSAQPAVFDVASHVDKLTTDHLCDVGIGMYLLNSDAPLREPDAIVSFLTQVLLPQTNDTYPQAALAALAASLVPEKLVHALKADTTYGVYEQIEIPLIGVLAQMERTGLGVNTSVLYEQSKELGVTMQDMKTKLKEAAGEDFNLDSPMQLSHILFDVWKLPTEGLKKTKKGFYSTNAKTLDELAHVDDRVRMVLDYRERAKIKSTYLDALPHDTLSDGRIHTTLNQTVAATGRLSSSEPNLQNIPTRSELGHRVRLAFEVAPQNVFLTCDYSQIELRLLAHLSQDEHLIAAFNSGADFHAATAARVFGILPQEVTPQLRSRAKAVNFGIVYGQQAFGLSTSLGIPRKEAQEMIDRYFEAYPGVRAYLDNCIKQARETGFATTMYGRKRHIADIHSKNFTLRSFAERTAMNHPMQGSAADIIKIAMIEVEKLLNARGLRSKMVLQIHDELDFEVPKDELEEISALVKETMEGVCKLRVPLIAEVSYGKTWAEAK